jgi:hypothetical protein
METQHCQVSKLQYNFYSQQVIIPVDPRPSSGIHTDSFAASWNNDPPQRAGIKPEGV